jgi:multidrug efflux pump subunit AcrA (membrane-fusion protein)
MARRSRSRQIEIFNFSFLDILACTIGLLIFIMVMVFILQSGSPVADTAAIVHRKSDEAQRQKLSADEDTTIANRLEEQLGRIHDSVKPELRAVRDVAAHQSDSARAAYESTLAQMHTVEAELDTARRARLEKSNSDMQEALAALKAARDRNEAAKALVAQAVQSPVTAQFSFLPSWRTGETIRDYDVLHIDCRGDAVAFLSSDADGNIHESDAFPVSAVGDKDSAFQQRIDAHALARNPLVLLWVRPDGLDTYHKVRDALPGNLAFGYEPADAAWRFSRAPK